MAQGPVTDDGEDDQDPVDALYSQLTALSQRATRATRRLGRPGCAPPVVSSPEVNEAFEHANTLIRIISNITAVASGRDDIALDSTTTDYGLVFLALASHQHLVALFRAICDAIRRCIESMAAGEHQQQQQRSLHHGDVGPSSVAQFVMVLQLLMHLINRVDRSLFQVDRPVDHGPVSSAGGITALAQAIVRAIPDEHEKLRQAIRELQTKMEHAELH